MFKNLILASIAILAIWNFAELKITQKRLEEVDARLRFEQSATVAADVKHDERLAKLFEIIVDLGEVVTPGSKAKIESAK